MATVCLQQQEEQHQEPQQQNQQQISGEQQQQQQVQGEQQQQGLLPPPPQQQQFATATSAAAAAAVPLVDLGGRCGAVGGGVVFVKGAPDRLLPLCKYQLGGNSNSSRSSTNSNGSSHSTKINGSNSSCAMPVDFGFWQEEQEKLSSQGLRVLAVCR
jgi:hypothetical protein